MSVAQPQVDAYGISTRPNNCMWLSVLQDIVHNVPKLEIRICCLCKIREFEMGMITDRKIVNLLPSECLMWLEGTNADFLNEMLSRFPTWVYATDTHAEGDVGVQAAHHIMDVIQDIETAITKMNENKRKEPDGGF